MLIGTIVTTVGLIVGAVAVGPVLRLFFGEPLDFNADYTSRPAMVQALTAHCVALVTAFFSLGVLRGFVRDESNSWALWAANPLTVALGYWAYRTLINTDKPYEYLGLVGWCFLSLAGPVLLVPTAAIGSRVGRGARLRRVR